MQLPMMDFILNGEVAVVVEGWVLCSRKGAAHTFLYSQVTLRVSSSRLNKTVEHDAKGQGRPYLDQSILSPAASARQYPRSMMQPTKTEAVVAVMQFGKPYKVGQARQRKGPMRLKRRTSTEQCRSSGYFTLRLHAVPTPSPQKACGFCGRTRGFGVGKRGKLIPPCMLKFVRCTAAYASLVPECL